MWFCVFAPVIASAACVNLEIRTEYVNMCSRTSISEDHKHLFFEVKQEIANNVMHMMETLWVNWSHLGIDDQTKCERIKNLIRIEKELHRDVIQETEQKLKALTNEVNSLKDEAKQLSEYLSVEIPIQDFPEDVMLADYKMTLESQIVGYRQQLEQRKTTIKRLVEWQRDLSEALGVPVEEVKESPLPSEEELAAMSSRLDQMQQERDRRMYIFLNTQKQIKEIMECLCLKPMLKFESLVVNSLSVQFRVTDHNMERLAELLHSLRDQMHTTENRVMELRERLNRLWEMLDEDRTHRNNFLQAHPGFGPDTERALREEIARCENIKKQKMQVLVARLRTEIKKMWDQCLYDDRQRAEFVHYRQEIFSEDTLTLHEMYLEDLKKIYNDNKHIYELVAQRRELWDKMVQLEAQGNDPSRYQNRGGQLLREEKQRKNIASKLPKIEAQLEEMVEQYRAANDKEFTVNGQPLLQVIKDEYAALKTERALRVTARKQALTPCTPGYRSLAVSPGKRNRTAAGLNTCERARAAKRPAVASSSRLPNNTERSALRRQAATTATKRMSGRIAALAAATGVSSSLIREKPRRKLNYDAAVPRIAVNANILKHKRRSRRSSRRSTRSHTDTSLSQEEPGASSLPETTMLTSYTNFKEHINENKGSRSSIVQGKVPFKSVENIKRAIHDATPIKTPRKQPLKSVENHQTPLHAATPKKTPLQTMRKGYAAALF